MLSNALLVSSRTTAVNFFFVDCGQYRISCVDQRCFSRMPLFVSDDLLIANNRRTDCA